MVMGHVHVCGGCDKCGVVKEAEECAHFTRGSVTKYLKWRETGEVPSKGYDGWLNTYLNFAKAFFGYEPDTIEKENELWDYILFYNYVQTSVRNWNEKPSKSDYENSQKPFLEVINKYEPDIIIVWGKPAYDNAPGGGNEEKPIKFEDVEAKCYSYTLTSGKRCTMISIHHPSMLFSFFKWHEIIKKTLTKRL